MEPKVVDLIKLQSYTAAIEITSSKTHLAEVFTERKAGYLNEFTLFLAYYNAIPNFIHEVRIDCKRANKWFEDTYKTEIKDLYFNKRYYNNSKKAEYDDIFYMLFDDLIVDFDTNSEMVRFLFKKTEFTKVEAVISEIRKFQRRKTKHKISLLVNKSWGLDTEWLSISKPKLNIECNYNDDFREIHETIINRLSRKNNKGLVILHGKPGTGKTSYIRYLISILKKQVIFLPPNMASSITQPDLISFLLRNPNSILVIEDAENIVIDREKEVNSPVSALLNISDGLLSDSLNIQLICSFNTDISKVDSALLRKGRLIAKYEFKELETAKAQILSQKLGFVSKFDSPMTLAAIYNQDERDFQQQSKRKVIGFKVSEMQ